MMFAYGFNALLLVTDWGLLTFDALGTFSYLFYLLGKIEFKGEQEGL